MSSNTKMNVALLLLLKVAEMEWMKMRVSKKDRRVLRRRQINRIPPYLLTKMKKLPSLVLVMACTLWLSPEAIAQSESKQIVVASDSSALGNSFSKTYSKDELKQKEAPKNPVPDLDEVLKGQVTSLFKVIADSQGKTLNEIDEKQKRRKIKDFGIFAAAMKDNKLKTKLDGVAMREKIQSQSRKALKSDIQGRFEIIKEVKSGLNFNLNIASFLTKKSNAAAQSSDPNVVRYGLIVKDIKPGTTGMAKAAINDSEDDQLMYAGQAEVVYTIGPVDSTGNSPLSMINDNPQYVPVNEDSSFLSRIAIPAPPDMSFKTNINTAGDMSEIQQAKGLPGMKISLQQTQGLYELIYETEENFKPKAATHQVNIPIVGELKVGRRFNDKFEVIETSGHNILISKKLPEVHVTYFHLEDRYSGGVKKDTPYGEIGATANVPRNKDKASKKELATEKYELKYNYKF